MVTSRSQSRKMQPPKPPTRARKSVQRTRIAQSLTDAPVTASRAKSTPKTRPALKARLAEKLSKAPASKPASKSAPKLT
ncbi:uncharacterized protein BDR25DRAFT_300627 [Lindgomyces ingoldianus]|uniref:Uncharacterized protein n=1 Tax=Lindgomyces ingoldianus TaxID=673940 RepID=A0ACB6RE46_9PLEO|nr:uncharacterized protein BDR25DRAFT_300627 [Lindgomyces ingoldianus]KAF2476787.1 hypothetical protein BDR25DRAFT_300627 [Lindgomyces ingoldianus]